MKQRSFSAATIAALCSLVVGCASSSSEKQEFKAGLSASSSNSGGLVGGGSSPSASVGNGKLGATSGSSSGSAGAGAGVTGDPRCNGGDTTISGTVYDPAVADPLYNITVFVLDPTVPLPTLAPGASCNSCSSLYPATVIASAITDAGGKFIISKSATGPVIPAGAVTLVVQTGKWRKTFPVTVTTCQDNPQPDKTLHLPANAADGDLPDIAISTGKSDSIECLPLRIGVSASEYTAGAAGPGHVHIFTGAGGAATAAGAVMSSASLWNSTPNLMMNDVVLLSCEGAEPQGMTAASQQSMYDYAVGGGRVFASHFHYAWFSNVVQGGPNTGPFSTFNLAAWKPGGQNLFDTTSLQGDVITTLNVGGGPFPEGLALLTWLGNVNALTNGKLPIFFTRHNADVTPINTPSQPWIELDPTDPMVSAMNANAAEYFSFDTPIAGSVTDGGSTMTCGRVVFSDIHVSGGPQMNQPGVAADYANGGGNIAPAGCAMHPLTAQEKALEFMLFDLSSCLQSVGQPPKVIIPPPR